LTDVVDEMVEEETAEEEVDLIIVDDDVLLNLTFGDV